MRNEPRELKLQKKPAPIRASQNERRLQTEGAMPAVIDEAFASLSDQPHRVDRGAQLVESREIIRQNQEIVANLVTQLEALERQRAKIAKLLDDIEA